MPALKRRKGEKKSQQMVRTAMHEFKRGQLHSGSKKGPKVKNRKQAIAIGLSQARRAQKHSGAATARNTKDPQKPSRKPHNRKTRNKGR